MDLSHSLLEALFTPIFPLFKSNRHYWEPTACWVLMLHDLVEKIVSDSADGNNNCLDITVYQTLSLSALRLSILIEDA